MNAMPHERLKAARLRHVKSARQAALDFGWPESTYRAHESGTRNFGLGDAMKYAEAFGCSSEWLHRNAGSPNFKQRSAATAHQALQTPDSLEGRRRLTVIGRSRDGRLILDGTVADYTWCPPPLEDVAESYSVFVIGDSMEPRYLAGEIVYIHPH